MNEYRCQVDCPAMKKGEWAKISYKPLHAMKTERTRHPQRGMVMLWNNKAELVLRCSDGGRREVQTKDREGVVHHRRIDGGVSVIPQLFTIKQEIVEKRER